MELEIKEADLIKIETGDILVVKIDAELPPAVEKRIKLHLDYLQERVEKSSGKKIFFMLLNKETDLLLYRKVGG
ncbi:MAG: hypothetical protein KAQ85_01450 [Thermodesulfovibrionia bacterium]|nr:hypothetical protein [Thermodesulfovibrionia bacterium]